MLATEVYYHKTSRRPGRWWYAVLELGRLGQVLERVACRRCRDKKEARRLARTALAHERNKRNGESQ